MKKGGYQIIDLKEKNLTLSVGMVYDGIYNAIESTNKPIMISGLVVGGTEYDDTFVECNVVGSNYECTLHGYKMTIQDNDVVIVTENTLTQSIGIEQSSKLTVDASARQLFNVPKGQFRFITVSRNFEDFYQYIIGAGYGKYNFSDANITGNITCVKLTDGKIQVTVNNTGDNDFDIYLDKLVIN